jgi:hypothetical protein
MPNMDYYDSDGDTPKSPGLVPITSNQNEKFPTFAATPLWLSEDTYGCPIVSRYYRDRSIALLT